MSDAPNVIGFDMALLSAILNMDQLRVSREACGEENPYFSLKPPPTPAPFLFTDTVASSNPQVAATQMLLAHRTKSKDRS